MKVRPEHRSSDLLAGMQHVVVVVPIDAQVDEAQHIAEEHRHQWRQSVDVLAMRHLHLQHHDRDDDGDHTIAESLKPAFSHRSRLS
jgi:hypothetical protein